MPTERKVRRRRNVRRIAIVRATMSLDPLRAKGTEMAVDELMNVRSSARLLGVSENSLRKYERQGRLKAVRLPGSGFRRFRREDIERMRSEMWSQFAPATSVDDLFVPEKKTRQREQLSVEEYG